MSKVGIILIHFKDSVHTKPCLDSLSKIKTTSNFQIYIISVQSQDAPELINHPTKPVIVNELQNLGFSGANNVLLKRAMDDGCEVLILLNNDTTVDENFLDPMINRLNEPNVGMVCPKIYFYPGYEFHHDKYEKSDRGHVIWYAGGLVNWAHSTASHWGVDEVDHGQFSKTFNTDFATGCCIAIKAETIKRIGFMDPDYFLYYEDTDWSRRVINAGLNIVVQPQSIVWHKNAGSTGGSGSSLHVYYQTRNRFRFGFKYAPLRTKFHLFIQLLKFLRSSDTSVRKAAIDVLFNRYGLQPFK